VGKGSCPKSPRKKFPEKVEKYKIVSEGEGGEACRLIMHGKRLGVSGTDD